MTAIKIRPCHTKTLESFGIDALITEINRLRFNHKTNPQIIGSLRIPVMMAHGCTPEYAENALWALLSRLEDQETRRDTLVSLSPLPLTNPRISHRAGKVVPEKTKEAMHYLGTMAYRINPKMAEVLRARINDDRLWNEVDRVGLDPWYMDIFGDWRARIYTDSRGMLSFQGDDTSRSMCEFYEAKPVGMADLMGFLDWIEEEHDKTLSQVLEIAEDPHEYLDKTQDSKPACTLAACFAYVEAATTGYSRYILQQDATCSGFQHIAMFLRDKRLARLVNVLPNRAGRKDLYMKVIARLIETRDSDWVEALKDVNQRRLRKQLAKPTVILTGYGSGSKPLALEFAGFVQTGQDKLTYEEVMAMVMGDEEIQLNPLPCLSKILKGKTPEDVLATCLVIADEMQAVLFEIAPSIKMFIKALRGRAVSVYNKSGGTKTMGWTNPHGFEVDLLGYRVSKEHEINEVCTTIDGERKRINILKMVADDCASQAPPCFVHTWDAYVIHLIALLAKEHGISVAMIHDSIGTHICDRQWVSNHYTIAMFEAHRDEHLNEVLKANGGKALEMGDLRIEDCLKARMVF